MAEEKTYRRILFFYDSAFSRRDYARFGIELLEKNGFKVEVWDLEKLVVKINVAYTPPDPFSFPGLRMFNNKTVLRKGIEELHEDDLVILIGFSSPRYFDVHKLLSASKADYAVFRANFLPRNKSNGWFGEIKRGGKRISQIGFFDSVDVLYNIFCSKMFSLRPATFVLCGGKKSFLQSSLVGETTKIIWAHTLDYDLYLRGEEEESEEEDIAVFLDEYHPFHPDWFLWGYTKNPLNPEKYYAQLCALFDKIEEEVGLRVVIAAHPRSVYEKHPDYFKGRTLHRGKTRELIRKSKLVITHASTANNFAVLYKKPVLFVTDSISYAVPQVGGVVKAMSAAFGKKPAFLDKKYIIDWKTEMKADMVAYDHYAENYIKRKGTPEEPFWQIVTEEFKH